MQDEIEDRAINLLIRTSELSLRTIVKAGKKYMEHRDKVKVQKAAKKAEKTGKRMLPRKGKQSVSELIGQGQGIENIELTEKAQKVIVDGVVYIVRDNKMFNIHGAQVR